MTWGEKLRAGGKMTTVTASLQRDVDKYQVPITGPLPLASPDTLSPAHTGHAASVEVREGRGSLSGALARDVPHAGISERNDSGETIVRRHSFTCGGDCGKCRQIEGAIQVNYITSEINLTH